MPIDNPAAYENDEFENAFDEISENEREGKTMDDLTDLERFRSPLGQHLLNQFIEYETDKRLTEERWIRDLRQYRGEYDPEVLAKLHPKRSKAFLSLTRTKTKTVAAREVDLLFPANGDKNWSIHPSPIPELVPNVIEKIMLQYQEATGEMPSEDMIRQFINEESEKRSRNMEKEMHDQLNALKYRWIIRQTIFDGNLYGTGILKGPLAKTVRSKRWLPNQETGEWITIELEKLTPYCENVSVWDVYPDMSAKYPEDMQGVFQRYIMNRHKVQALADRPDFNGEAIKEYLRQHPNGDAELKTFENDLWSLNNKSTNRHWTNKHESAGPSHTTRKGKYELKEYWGYLSADQLRDAGVAIPEEFDLEVAANVWLLGDIIIKANISPIEGVQLPYHFYYYDKDDTSLWGEGIPAIMRDAQSLFNASVRAMLDNAAISAGPIIEANTDLLEPDEDPKDLYPFRTFLRDGQGSDAMAQAIRVYSLPSHTNEFMAMINFFMSASDEVTAIPRYMYGDTQNVGGAGKTASGLSMLMGAANVTVKDQIKNFDDGITLPFIKALYFWNMEFNPKENIKGDYEVVAKGSTSLIAREVKAESLITFMNVTNNPTDLMYTKRDNVLREYTKVLDLDDMDLIKDPHQVKMEETSRAQAQQENEKFEKELALMKAKSGGHMNNDPGTGFETTNDPTKSLSGGGGTEIGPDVGIPVGTGLV
ncbi:MAG: portal protein [Planctomycetota bacterium]|jgi:hypothetical protein